MDFQAQEQLELERLHKLAFIFKDLHEGIPLAQDDIDFLMGECGVSKRIVLG